MDEKMSAVAALKHMFDTGDREPFAALFAPGCVNWHNSDKLEVPAEDFGGGSALQRLVENVNAEIIQHETFEAGEMIRLVIRGTVRSTGRPLEAHNCIVLTTSERGIVRIDDYVDPTFGDQLRPDAG